MFLLLAVLDSAALVGLGMTMGDESSSLYVIFAVVAIILALILCIMLLVQRFKLSFAFGKGVLFALGLLIFQPICTMILGFGGSKYKGTK